MRISTATTATLCWLLGACGGSSPSNPSSTGPGDVSGIWNGTAIVSAATLENRNDCSLKVLSDLAATLPSTSSITVTLQQHGTAVSGKRTDAATGASCNLSGSWDGRILSLTEEGCILACSRFSCNGERRDLCRVAGTCTGTATGGRITASCGSTWQLQDPFRGTSLGIFTLTGTLRLDR